MSIKIYNGWRLGQVDVFEIQTQVNGIFRDALLKSINSKTVGEAIRMQDLLHYKDGEYACRVHHLAEKPDYFKFHPENKGSYDIVDLWAISKKADAAEDGISPEKVEVIYFSHPETKEIFCFVYAGNEYLEMFEEEFGEPFHYWNNADGPAEIPEDEWYARYGIWNSVLDLSRPTGPQGLLQTVLDRFDSMPSLDYIQKGNSIHVPDMEERVTALAEAIVDIEYGKTLSSKDDFDYGYFFSPRRKEAIRLQKEELTGILMEIDYEWVVENLAPRKRKR